MRELEILLGRGVINIEGNNISYNGFNEENYLHTDSGTLSSEQLDSITEYLSYRKQLNDLKASALSKLTDDEIKALKTLGEI